MEDVRATSDCRACASVPNRSAPDGDGTAIRWEASFAPKVFGAGWLLERGLRRFLEQCARGLAEHAAH